ncbi:MAG: 3-hydroxyacyl-ACP dehydratase [Flavobacteriaceae bacterium]|nr:3-hydroxyacyl-ACP dehydratase [Flavobacteriaceae bacterium]
MILKDFYTVQSQHTLGSTITTIIAVNKDHEIFKGHFPNNPVMPGVCMIQIIKEITEEVTKKSLFISVLSNIKFMALINPEENPILKIETIITEEDNEVKIKNTSWFQDTMALKLSATFKITDS